MPGKWCPVLLHNIIVIIDACAATPVIMAMGPIPIHNIIEKSMQELQSGTPVGANGAQQMLNNVGTMPKLMSIAESCCYSQWYSYPEQSANHDCRRELVQLPLVAWAPQITQTVIVQPGYLLEQCGYAPGYAP